MASGLRLACGNAPSPATFQTLKTISKHIEFENCDYKGKKVICAKTPEISVRRDSKTQRNSIARQNDANDVWTRNTEAGYYILRKGRPFPVFVIITESVYVVATLLLLTYQLKIKHPEFYETMEV